MVEAKAHQHSPYDYTMGDYLGDSSLLQSQPLSLVMNDSGDGRYVESRIDSESMYVDSYATGTGVFDVPFAAAHMDWRLSFANTPELQNLVAANGGQPVTMYARFYLEFTLSLIPGGGGIFGQTSTTAKVHAESFRGGQGGHFGGYNDDFVGSFDARLDAGNGHGTGPDDHHLFTSGALTPDLIGAGPFSVLLPFQVGTSSPESLTALIRMWTFTEALVLGGDRPIGSSVKVWYPTHDDIFLASGESAESRGLEFDTTFNTTSVPEPSSIALLAMGGIGAIGSFRRKLRRTA